jgi:plastocyanin
VVLSAPPQTIAVGERVQLTATARTFAFQCTIHPGMTGQVVVTP